MLSLIISLPFVGYVIYISQPGSTVFSWHPTLMSLAFALFVQAVRSLSADGILGSAKHSTKVMFHWMLVAAGIISASLGFCAVYTSKQNAQKPHFTTPHGQLGIGVIIYVLIQACAGTNLRFPAMATKFVPYGTLRKMHGLSGTFLTLLATLVLIGGVTSDFFKMRAHSMVWYLCLVAPIVLWIFILKQFLQSKPPPSKKLP